MTGNRSIATEAFQARPTRNPEVNWRVRAFGLILILPLTMAWAQPTITGAELAATEVAAADSSGPSQSPPERITNEFLARWPNLLREDWSDGLKIDGRDPGGRWIRTMVNDTKWHKEHEEKQVFTYAGQNGQTFNPFTIVKHNDKSWLRITARAT